MGSTNTFSALFGKSPFKAIQQHMRLVTECVGYVTPMFEALVAGQEGKIQDYRNKIVALEHQADAVENEMRAHLHKSLFLPVDRRDLLDLLEFQDNIADMAQDIADLLVARRMDIPAEMGSAVIALAKRSQDACAQAGKVIEELDSLVEMGFGGRESEKVLAMVGELSQIESETDTMALALVRTLFANEDAIKPVSVVLWYQLINWIGDLADNAEKVGDRLRLLTAR